jgi:transcriptional regulator with XRE-family HTH domain
MSIFSDKLRQLREDKDLSLRELAKKLDVSAAFLSDIELGRRFPSDQTMKDLASFLGVDYELLRGLDQRAPVEELKRKSETDQVYGLALRTMIDDEVSGAEVLQWLADRKTNRDTNGQSAPIPKKV